MGLAGQYSNTGQLKLTTESAAKAYALRDRVSENERARITAAYYGGVTVEVDKAIEAAEEYTRNYPRDPRGLIALGSQLRSQTDQTEKALALVQEGLHLDPNNALAYAMQANILTRLKRYAGAGETLQHALAQKLDGTVIRQELYDLAFINGDAQAMQEQIARVSGKPEEHVAVDWQMQTAAFAGEWRKSQEHLRRAVELALRAEDKENASTYTSYQALRAAWLGQFAEAVRLAEAAPKIERNFDVLFTAAFALAFAGQAAKAQPLIQELEQNHPKNTVVNQLYVPEIKAALALHKGDAQRALDLLEPAKRFESWDESRQQTLRALAYTKLGKGAEASAEARKVIDHRGEGPRSLLWPLAHLNLARASAMQGDTAQARQAYDAFFKLWQSADRDLPILIEAKREYGKLNKKSRLTRT